ncbi:MAG: hypothetical protein M3P27_11200 [Acidobacteriota bacterium]|nr:hypothetical protein [Acidobacteriota bacterium]
MRFTSTVANAGALLLCCLLAGPLLRPEQQAQSAAISSDAFSPGHQRPLKARHGKVALSLLGEEPCRSCPAGRRFRLLVSGVSKQPRSLTLANETAQIDSVYLVDASLTIIVGRVLANTSIVTLIENDTGSIRDSFYCFWPAVSDDRRYVAYVKVFPAHFVEGETSEYLLYDVKLTPRANRIQPAVLLSDHINVGRPIYPPGSVNRPGDNTLVAEAERHEIVANGLYWLPVENLAFVDRVDGGLFLVVADLSAHTSAAKIAVTPVQIEAIVDPARCKTFQVEPHFAFQVAGISRGSADNITINLVSNYPGCLVRNELTVHTKR